MKKALSEIVKATTSDGKKLNVSIVDKESETGITSHQRLFILVENQTFGYISQFKETDDPSNIDISKCKVIVPIPNLLRQPQRNKNTLIISFWMLQNQKRVNKKWSLKMASQNIALEWQRIFTNETEKDALKKSCPNGQKSSAGPNTESKMKISNSFMINKSPSRIIKPSEQAAEQKKSEGRIQKKKSITNLNKDRPPQKIAQIQHKNELYESQSKNNESGKFANQFQLPNSHDARKLQVEEPPAKVLQEQPKHQPKEQKQMHQIMPIEQVPQPPQNQKEAKQESKPQENQHKNQEDFNQAGFHQENNMPINQYNQYDDNQPNDKLKPVNNHQELQEKQNSYKEESPSKSKVSFTKDGKVVENVPYNKSNNNLAYSPNKFNKQNNDGASEIETVHDHLFNLQKLKFNQQKLQQKEQPITLQDKKKDTVKSPINFGWTYRYLIKESEGQQYEIISQFSQFCSNVLKDVVQQFHQVEQKRKLVPKYRNEQYQLYEYTDVQFKIVFIQLKQIYSTNEINGRDNVCDQTNVKQLQNQFKRFKTLYRLIKQSNSRVLRVPLCCLCEYQGFVALFKTKPQFESLTSLNSDKKVQVDLQLMSNISKLNIELLSSSENAVIRKLNNDYYKQLSAQLGHLHTQFQFFIIWQVNKLIPPDLLFSGHFNEKNNQADNQQISHYLRQELLNQYYTDPEQNVKQMLCSLKKEPKAQESGTLKVQKNILEAINQVTQQLDSLDEYFLHPQQISKLMHEKGINMRYLYLVYDHSNLHFTKTYIISQIAGRVCKALFRKTIQDVVLEQQKDQSKPSYTQKMYYKIIDFLNCILGNSQETQFIWKLLSTHSYQFFNVLLSLKEIQKGYFFTSLVHHCGIQVDWEKIDITKVFSSNQFFNDSNFLGVKVKYKQYDFFLNQEQQILMKKIEQDDPQAFKTFQKVYKMQQSKLPLKFKNRQTLNKIRRYLSNFIPPDSTSFRQQSFLSLYDKNQPLSRTQFDIKFMELKWYLKKQKKQKYISAFNSINETIISTYGDFHPLLDTLYSIMCMYHRNNGEFQDAITFAKSSVISMLKICGSVHPKVGECYYHLAVCCIKANKKQQALVSLQKAKTILETNHKQKDVAYAHVCLKLGLIFLSEGKPKEAVTIIKFALSNFNDHMKQNSSSSCPNPYEQQKVQCFQILDRCYELEENKEQQHILSCEALKQVTNIKTATNLQKLIKIILYPLLSSQSASDAQIYLNIIEMLPTQHNANLYMKSFEKIHQRVQQQSLVDNFRSYLQNIKAIYSFIRQKNNLKQWKALSKVYERETVNDFLSLTDQIIYFLGQGYLTGALRDNL